MDPHRTLLDALDAYLAEDYQGAADKLGEYHHWRINRGAAPDHIPVGPDLFMALLEQELEWYLPTEAVPANAVRSKRRRRTVRVINKD